MTALGLGSALLAREGFVHAFFTREGGASEGPYASLNFAVSTGDEAARVGENLRRAAAALGVLPARVYFLSQVHGTASRAVTGADDREAVVREQGDIVVSRDPSCAAGVRSADCVPILIADRASGAVAAVHAGWRGVELDAAGAGVAALRALAGGPGDLIAAIGPHISLARFEVGLDVAARLEAGSPAPGVAVREGAKARVDLRRVVEAQLRRAGVAAIDHVAGCTVGEPERFFSYRRDGEKSGRLLSAIAARARG